MGDEIYFSRVALAFLTGSSKLFVNNIIKVMVVSNPFSTSSKPQNLILKHWMDRTTNQIHMQNFKCLRTVQERETHASSLNRRVFFVSLCLNTVTSFWCTEPKGGAPTNVLPEATKNGWHTKSLGLPATKKVRRSSREKFNVEEKF